jgi:MFS family permease
VSLTVALIATTAAQVLATLAAYAASVLAPAMVRDLGIAPNLVGAQVALMFGAASLASLNAGRILARTGPARCTQLALGFAASGLVAFSGGLPGAVLGTVLLGLGYGLTAPAATLVLSRVTPPARRNLVFAIKQMGVPIGGTLAGLLLPSLALALSWRGALVAVAGVILAAILAFWPLRRAWDQGPALSGGPGSGIVATLRSAKGLAALAAIGASFSAVQLSLSAYAVTMLVHDFGWTPVAAGAAAAASQASGAVARLAWAVVADWTRSGLLVLAAIGLGTAAGCLLVPVAPHWPDLLVLLLLCQLGACAAGWNGVALAEIARLAPPGLAGAATGAVMAITYGGVVVGPLLFAGLATLAGTTTYAFAAAALLPLAGAAIAWRARA